MGCRKENRFFIDRFRVPRNLNHFTSHEFFYIDFVRINVDINQHCYLIKTISENEEIVSFVLYARYFCFFFFLLELHIPLKIVKNASVNFTHIDEAILWETEPLKSYSIFATDVHSNSLPTRLRIGDYRRFERSRPWPWPWSWPWPSRLLLPWSVPSNNIYQRFHQSSYPWSMMILQQIYFILAMTNFSP